MTYKGNAAVSPDVSTKRTTQGKHHVEFLNVKPGGT
jgi:hypothetical protein